ncbi:MAG: helix-turn-helix domain-containing protein [Clostridia bacterium]|nr:helix-turn-helix domain-containing protein [Clostridia bacterium]
MGGVNVNLLKAKLVERGLNITSLAKMIAIDKATLYRKLQNNGAGLLVKEANDIVQVLNLTVQEAMEIFFAQRVA